MGSTVGRGGGCREQSVTGMVEIERTVWSDLRQENSKKTENPDIPDSDSIDVVLRLRNMANVR